MIKNKKGMSSQIMILILVLISVVLMINFATNSFKGVTQSAKGWIDDVYKIETSSVEANDLLIEPIPQELLDYTKQMTEQMFTDRSRCSKGDSSTGKICLIDSFDGYLNNKGLYNKFTIDFSYSDWSVDKGIVVSIYNTETDQRFVVDSYRLNADLLDKHLCLLSDIPDSVDVGSAIYWSLRDQLFSPRSVDIKKYEILSLTPSEIIKESRTSQLRFRPFHTQNTGVYFSQTWQFNVRSSSQFSPILYFHFNNYNTWKDQYLKFDAVRIFDLKKFPIYVYEDNLCFFPLTLEQEEGVYFNENNKFESFKGALSTYSLNNLKKIVQGDTT